MTEAGLLTMPQTPISCLHGFSPIYFLWLLDWCFLYGSLTSVIIPCWTYHFISSSIVNSAALYFPTPSVPSFPGGSGVPFHVVPKLFQITVLLLSISADGCVCILHISQSHESTQVCFAHHLPPVTAHFPSASMKDHIIRCFHKIITTG